MTLASRSAGCAQSQTSGKQLVVEMSASAWPVQATIVQFMTSPSLVQSIIKLQQ